MRIEKAQRVVHRFLVLRKGLRDGTQFRGWRTWGEIVHVREAGEK